MTINIANKEKEKNFFRSMEKGAWDKRLGLNIMFELTYKCNFRCFHCYLQGSPKGAEELNTKQIFVILDQLREMNIFHVTFTGGEPLMRKDIFKILGYANKLGLRTGLLTNGSLVDKKAADALLNVNVAKVDITLNALDSKIFNKMTGAKNSLGKVKKAIEMLAKRKIETTIRSTATTLNESEIPKIEQYARKLNILHVFDAEILSCRNGNTSAVKRFSLSVKRVNALTEKVWPERFSSKGKKVASLFLRKNDHLFECAVGKSAFLITPYGKMNLCLMINYPQYDILSNGLEKCWNKIKKKVDVLNNTKNLVCIGCEFFKFCNWCPGKSYSESGNFNRCCEVLKKVAVEAKNERRRIVWTQKKF